MKKTLKESQQRIYEIMNQIDETFIEPELQYASKKLMELLRNNINRLGEIISTYFNKEKKLILTGELGNIEFSVHLSKRGQIEGFYIYDGKTETKGFVKTNFVEPEYDDVIEAISEIIFTDSTQE
jgi:hypothetical protein